MKYQLVLQWPASSSRDYDAMLEIESVLIGNLDKESEVDGHDAGSDQVNIFILTDDPKRTFKQVKTILSNPNFWIDARVAYRELAKSEYIALWPKGLTKFTVK